MRLGCLVSDARKKINFQAWAPVSSVEAAFQPICKKIYFENANKTYDFINIQRTRIFIWTFNACVYK